MIKEFIDGPDRLDDHIDLYVIKNVPGFCFLNEQTTEWKFWHSTQPHYKAAIRYALEENK